jgi:hypothetical protein
LRRTSRISSSSSAPLGILESNEAVYNSFVYVHCNDDDAVTKISETCLLKTVAYPDFFFLGGGGSFRQEFFSGGFKQIQLRAEGRENGDLGAVAPLVRGSTQSANE